MIRNLQDKLRDPAMTALLVLETAVMFVMSPLRQADFAALSSAARAGSRNGKNEGE